SGSALASSSRSHLRSTDDMIMTLPGARGASALGASALGASIAGVSAPAACSGTSPGESMLGDSSIETWTDSGAKAATGSLWASEEGGTAVPALREAG